MIGRTEKLKTKKKAFSKGRKGILGDKSLFLFFILTNLFLY